MDEYTTNKSIGLYIFSATFAISMLWQMSFAPISYTMILVALFYGIAAWGIGNILWTTINDYFYPVIQTSEDSQIVRPPEPTLQEHIDKHLDGNRFYARGMITLTSSEIAQIQDILTSRWNKKIIDTSLSLFSPALLEKLQGRNVLTENGTLSKYGREKIFIVNPNAS